MHDSHQKTRFHFFCCTFSKHIWPSCKVQRQTNEMPLAIYLDFPKFTFNFTLRRKHLLNLSSAILRSDWDMSTVVCQPPKQQKKCWNRWNRTMWDWDTSKWMLWWVSSWQKSGKKEAKGWRKRLQKGGDDYQMGHWQVLASFKNYKHYDPSDFLLFLYFYDLIQQKWKKKRLKLA